MLIWINGAFGAGKTSVAEALQERIDGSRIYDPELVGSLLGYLLPDVTADDFQDLPIWRTLTADAASAILGHYGGPLVVPMTVVVPDYQNEIFGRLEASGHPVRVFSLIVSPEELRARIRAQVMIPDDPEADERTRTWRLAQVDRCVEALADPSLGEPVSNEGRGVDETVDAIVDRLAAESS